MHVSGGRSIIPNIGSTRVVAPPQLAAAFDALDAAVAAIGELDFDTYDPAVRLRALQRLEAARRWQVVLGHDIIAELPNEDRADIGGPVHKVVADWLRISPPQAGGTPSARRAAGCVTPSS
jgi:hypothetical protein